MGRPAAGPPPPASAIPNLRAAYLHVLADALTSVAAIAALLAARYLGWLALDPIVALVASAVIVRWAVSLCVVSARPLLDLSPPGELAERVRAAVEEAGEARVVDLHLWPLGAGRHACVVTLRCGAGRGLLHYRERIARAVNVAHLTVEVEETVEASALPASPGVEVPAAPSRASCARRASPPRGAWATR